ncbi:DNA-3-methyladenine glycosylase I [Alkalihalophilus lindianensis]|uniref:DNA-3-methyladenine glycosylase I n=1 Tax=Alkalihalophilus lindianensis TaxID=1630542 RepID=A0ABU3X5N9_9BACI|nr:DNA-3-methyladenine glycosylase I [Alkalihalophilus lindianensis]MDV2683216.1 DNA-3-methyladenine glycosylase I [Alkalihalophilus lindianensis]
MIKRCKWCKDDPLMIKYHDEEWGRRVKEDRKLFEALTLEVFQAGLSWRTVLYKREQFRVRFYQFNLERVAGLTEKDVERLLQDPGIIRHRKKMEATIENAQRIVRIVESEGSFYQWMKQLPKDQEQACKIVKNQFKHVGITTAESFIIAVGVLPTPHDEQCFLHN